MKKETSAPAHPSFPIVSLWRRFAENDFLCFIGTDNKGIIRFINQAGENIYGYSTEELIGKHIGILYRGIKITTSLYKLLKQKSRLAVPWQAEIWNVRKNGEKFPIWIATNYLVDEWGERIGALSIARDITGDMHAREESHHLANLAERVNMALISTDVRGKILTINKAAEDLFGYRSEELIGKSVNILYSLDNPPEVLKEIKKKIKQGMGYVADLYRKKKDGSEFITWLSTAPLYDDSGEIKGFLGIGRDITAEKKTEQKMSYMAEVVDRANMCILSTDNNHNIQTINPAGEKMYGYKAEELIGKNRDILYRGILLPEGKRVLYEKMEKGEPWIAELDNVRKNGEVFPIRIATAYLYDKKGRRKGAVSIAEDITELRKLQDDLIEKKKLAFLGEVALGIAHEINNPLSVIKGAILILGQNKEIMNKEENRQILNDLETEVHSLEEVTKGFLKFSRRLYKQLADLNQLIRDFIRILSYDKKLVGNISLQVKHNDVDPIFIDVIQIQEVLRNLAFNSIQAMKLMTRGNVKKILKITSFHEKDYVGFTVKDTGPGIPPDVAQNIWKPFFSARGQGSGLGLSIVKRIIDQPGGKVTLESAPGKGTVFTVFLPKGEIQNQEPR